MVVLLLARSISGALTVKAGCFTAYWNAVAFGKTFLKEMEVEPPAGMRKGPWASGGSARPMSGMRYCPPNAELSCSVALASPSWQGSKVTSTLRSEPPAPAGAALMDFAVWKSAQSVCAGETRDHGGRVTTAEPAPREEHDGPLALASPTHTTPLVSACPEWA